MASKIEEILRDHFVVGVANQEAEKDLRHKGYIIECSNDLYNAMSEVIGEDDPKDGDGYATGVMGKARNQLRKAQRKRLNKLFGKETK